MNVLMNHDGKGEGKSDGEGVGKGDGEGVGKGDGKGAGEDAGQDVGKGVGEDEVEDEVEDVNGASSVLDGTRVAALRVNAMMYATHQVPGLSRMVGLLRVGWCVVVWVWVSLGVGVFGCGWCSGWVYFSVGVLWCVRGVGVLWCVRGDVGCMETEGTHTNAHKNTHHMHNTPCATTLQTSTHKTQHRKISTMNQESYSISIKWY